MNDYRQLRVWQQAHQLTLDVYAATRKFPKEEMYALGNQMRRASYSIPSNLAEGCVHTSPTEFARYVQIATGSASELDYQLLLAADLGYVDEHTLAALRTRLTSVRKMLSVLRQRLRPAPSSKAAKPTTNN